MKLLVFLFSIHVISNHSIAQDTAFIVNAGQKVNDVIPIKDQYHYAEFLNGKVFYRDGGVTEAKMNYNRLTDEMLFIGHGGDTLALANEATIKFISIKKDTFYFDQGYILLVGSNNVSKLGAKQGFKLVDKKKEAAYDLPSSSASVSSFSSFNDGKISHPLKMNQQSVFIKYTQYYFRDKYDHFVLATRKNLVELFPKCEQQLKKFHKKNRINFTKEVDLKNVITFMDSHCL
jgi:hypothetical protein